MRKLVKVTVIAVALLIAAVAVLVIYTRYHISDVPDLIARRAEAGDPEAQVAVGLSNRIGVSRDDAKALEWFRKAAAQGNLAGEYQVGESFEKGRGVPKDISQAVEWYRKAAEQGYPQARSALRQMYFNGEIIPRVDSQGGEWWRKLVEQADSEAQAFITFRMVAERGDSDAQINLGVFYLTGVGTPRNRDEAEAWLRKAAEQGSVRAQCLFASLKASDADWGAGSNGLQAFKICKNAANAGYVDAQWVLGMLYATGRGVRKDVIEAAAWIRKAAEQGRADAQWRLSYMYQKGEGVPKDPAQARAWLEKAARQGYPDAPFDASLSAGGDSSKGTADTKSLSDLAIEHSADRQRDLFPNLWDSPLSRANQQKKLGPIARFALWVIGFMLGG